MALEQFPVALIGLANRRLFVDGDKAIVAAEIAKTQDAAGRSASPS